MQSGAGADISGGYPQFYVHWVTAAGTDCETATREIVAGFERYLEAMYD